MFQELRQAQSVDLVPIYCYQNISFIHIILSGTDRYSQPPHRTRRLPGSLAKQILDILGIQIHRYARFILPKLDYEIPSVFIFSLREFSIIDISDIKVVKEIAFLLDYGHRR